MKTYTKILNPFSLKVYQYLHINFPQLLTGISFHSFDFGAGFFRTEVVSPNDTVAYNLILDTEDNQLTLIFDLSHIHFHTFGDSLFEPEMEAMIQFTKDIIGERLVSVGFFKDQILGSGGFYSANNLEPINFEHSEYRFGADRVMIKSWLGNLDHTIVFSK